MKRTLRGTYIVIVLIFGALALSACGNRATKACGEKQIVVTIPPLQGLVKEIVGEDYEVACLLPAGASPETYSPTARQVSMLADAQFVFTVGTLSFEQELVWRLENQRDKVVATAEGIELLAGCGHSHNVAEEAHEHECEHGEEANHEAVAEHGEHAHSHHHHSVDPHAWLAPRELQVIVDNIAREIIAQNPDSTKYRANYEQLKAKLEQRTEAYREVLVSAPRAFLIYHPALGYLAKEYGLEQISLENEGKTPTPVALAGVVDRVEKEGLKTMFYQQEYPISVVKPIAEILGVNLVEINPLSSDIISELDNIVKALTNNNE